MFTRKLGRSNIAVSAMGLGCYAIGGQFRVENGQQWGWTGVDDRESIRAIHAAVELGVNNRRTIPRSRKYHGANPTTRK